MALGVIPPLCATLGPVLAGPEGCSRGRWRSGPSKWRHTAAPEGRVREHHAPVGALRRCQPHRSGAGVTRQGAPRTCRCIETHPLTRVCRHPRHVREHHAPVGALRLAAKKLADPLNRGQGAPRTCRCIETRTRPDNKVRCRQGAPRTCDAWRCCLARLLTCRGGASGRGARRAPVGAIETAPGTGKEGDAS